MSILSFCSSRNWSQQKPDLFRLCDYSRWSCMHGLQVNLVSGMAQANDTKGGQMNPLLEGRQSFYLVHFLICQKRPIQNETQGLCIAGCLLLGMNSLYVDKRRWFSPCKGFLSQIASWLLCTICLFHYHSGIPSWKKTK